MLKRVRTGTVANLPHDVVFVILTGFLELNRSVPAVRLGADGLISKPLTPAVAAQKLSQLFGTDAARDVRSAEYQADKATDNGGALDPKIIEDNGNEERELPTDLVTPGVVLSRDLNYLDSELLLPKGAKNYHAPLDRLQEVAELSGGVHRLWVRI